MSSADAEWEKSLYPATLPTEPAFDKTAVESIAKKIVDAVAGATGKTATIFCVAGNSVTLSAAKKAVAVFNSRRFAWSAEVSTYNDRNEEYVRIYLRYIGYDVDL